MPGKNQKNVNQPDAGQKGEVFIMKETESAAGRPASIRSSIRKKILTLSAVIVLPFLVLSAVLLVSMSGYRRSYEEIVRNIAVANDYNLNF